MYRGTLDTAPLLRFSRTGLSPSIASFSKTVLLTLTVVNAVLTPVCTHSGLGSSDFARRYSRNHCCFLFLTLLRCFSSGGSLRTPMDSVHGTQSLSVWVSPFGDPRIAGYVLLPVAFRSLSRPSSAPDAKAFALCSFLLTCLHHFRDARYA